MRQTWLMMGILAALSWIACGGDSRSSDDDDGGGARKSSSSSSGQGGGSTGPGSGQGGSAQGGGAQGGSGQGGGAPDCNTVCNDLFDCGLAGVPQHCPGFLESDRLLFLHGPNGSSGCLAQCAAQPLLASAVDPNDCAGTVATIGAVNQQFACVCELGVGDISCAN